MRNTRPSAYIAAPLFNPIEREFNLKLSARLENVVDVFLPQRDGGLLAKEVQDGASVADVQREIYQIDVEALRRVDMVVAVLDGRTVDEGVAYEMGYAGALGKICVGLKTDDRFMLPTGDNPMIICGCAIITHSVENLIICMKKFVSNSQYFSSPIGGKSSLAPYQQQ